MKKMFLIALTLLLSELKCSETNDSIAGYPTPLLTSPLKTIHFLTTTHFLYSLAALINDYKRCKNIHQSLLAATSNDRLSMLDSLEKTNERLMERLSILGYEVLALIAFELIKDHQKQSVPQRNTIGQPCST